MQRFLLYGCLSFALLTLAFGGLSHAVPMLDQEFDPANKDASGFVGTGFSGPSFNFDRAQVFTVGLAGTLSSVELMLNRNQQTVDNLLLDIRTAPPGGGPSLPNSGPNVLGMLSVAPTAIPIALSSIPTTFTSFDLSSLGINVSVGDRLAIVLRSPAPTPGGYNWTGSSIDVYSGGSSSRRVNSLTWGNVSSGINSHVFRTFVDDGSVDPDPIPIPSTFLLFGLGFAGLAAWRWIKEKHA